MIFVTMGSAPFDFSRLAKKMDEISGVTGEEAIIQLGFTKYKPLYAAYFDFVPYEKALNYFRAAAIIVGHASAGPLVYARKFNKPLILVPRNSALGEHVDDHQIETANAIAGTSGLIEVIYDENKLQSAVQRALSKVDSGQKYKEPDTLNSLILSISDFVEKINV